VIVRPPSKQLTPAYVLWLLRREDGLDRKELDRHFFAGTEDTEQGYPFTAASKLGRILWTLQEAGWIEQQEDRYVATRKWEDVSALGFDLSELARAAPGVSRLVTPFFGPPAADPTYAVFVVMPFTDEMGRVYAQSIKGAVEGLGVSCGRADDFYRSSQIMDDVWSGIVHADCVVADCTGRNPNVFYEIGIAHTLGKQVLLLAQATEDIPFDVNHLRFITYEPTDEGLADLATELKTTIARILAVATP
jgi:hypothetical protein